MAENTENGYFLTVQLHWEMSAHHETGIQAEHQAALHLISIGYSILHRNYRHSRFEIDIIATKDEILHFIEAKSLSTDEIVAPEVHVTSKKFQSLKKAASNFLSKNPKYKHVQFDVLSIVMKNNTAPEFFLIEDVYL